VCYTLPMPALSAVVVDLGGTHLRAAYFDGTRQQPARQLRRQTPQVGDALPILEAISNAIRDVTISSNALAAIAVGTPGPVDPFRGVVLSAPNIPGWHSLPIRDWLGKHFRATIHIANDANMAALGELVFGAGRGAKELLYLTLGTGIGGAVISSGRLLLGRHGLATELGHVTVVPDGPECSCGQAGHIEALASGPAIAGLARRRLAAGAPSSLASLHATNPESITPEAIGDAAGKGDGFARGILQEAGTLLGGYIADCLAIFSPERVILGGGLMALKEFLLPSIRTAVSKRVMSPVYVDQLIIEAAELGDDAALYGGYALCLDPDLQPAPPHP
jgi:glucokinase